MFHLFSGTAFDAAWRMAILGDTFQLVNPMDKRCAILKEESLMNRIVGYYFVANETSHKLFRCHIT
jgi:hypothetical protein